MKDEDEINNSTDSRRHFFDDAPDTEEVINTPKEPTWDDNLDMMGDEDLLDEMLSEEGEIDPRDPTRGRRILDNIEKQKKDAERINEELGNARAEQAKDTKEVPPEEKNGDDGNDNSKSNRPDELEQAKQEHDNNKENESPSDNQKTSNPTSPNQNSEEQGNPQNQKNEEQSNPQSQNSEDQNNPQSHNSEEQSQSNQSQSTQTEETDEDGRKLLYQNPDGTKVYEKNQNDHKADERNVNRLKLSQAKNKYDQIKNGMDAVSHPIETGKAYAKRKAWEKAKEKVIVPILQKLAPLLPYIAIGIGILIGAIILIALIYAVVSAILIQENEKNVGANGYGYYDAPCQEITVTGEDAGTYSLEVYVAGVVQKEVGAWNNLVVDEVFAVAARTYGLARAANNNCTIANGTSTQAFTANPGETALQAAENTKGIVLTDSSGNLASTEYDALAVASTDSEYVTLKQKGQKIPLSWINSHISSSNLAYYAKHNHGRGMSQWGAYYLAEQGKNFEEILSYYYDDLEFKSTFIGAGLEGVPDYPLDSSSGTILRGQSLANFLASKGTSIEEFNSLINSNVNNAGRGTRAGVVSSAVTLIGEMEKYGIKLPYVWGGGHGSISNGADGNWGTGSGLDCSGFISWAIYNGGYNFNVHSSTDFRNVGEVVSLSANEPVIQPGDVLWKKGHVALVVGIDNNSKEYITAEALGAKYGVLFQRRKFNASSYSGVRMDSYYNNTGNVR